MKRTESVLNELCRMLNLQQLPGKKLMGNLKDPLFVSLGKYEIPSK